MGLFLAAFPFPAPAFAARDSVPPPAADGEKTVAELGAEMAGKYGRRRPVLWGEHLPGIADKLPGTPRPSSGNRTSEYPDAPPGRTLALTLDACDGQADKRIIALLREHGVPATVFATNSWLRRNKAVAGDLAADPLFALACHGKRHKPASVNGRRAHGINGTQNIPALVEEVEENARAITAVTGTRPRWYRSGTAYYDDVALEVIRDLGLAVAGYAVSADQGATLPASEVARRLMAAPDGAVILCHMNHPESGTFRGLAIAIPALLEQGVRFALLSTNNEERAPAGTESSPRTSPRDVPSPGDDSPAPAGRK